MIISMLKNRCCRLTLFWRIYLYALFLLVAITIAGIAITHLTDLPSKWHKSPRRLASLIAKELDNNRDNPVQLQRDLDALYFLIQNPFAIYRIDGTMLAKAGPVPPPALPLKRANRLAKRISISQGVLAGKLPSKHFEDAYFVLAFDKGKIHLRFTLFLVGVMGFLALLACPLAHFILKPLKKVNKTVQTLAEGDLSARTGICRQDEIGLLAQTIDEMAKRLESHLRSEKELLANISHEFRTPLARMRVALELSCEGADPDGIRTYLQSIEEDVVELDQLVADVLMASRLDLSKGESRQMTIRRERIEVFDLLENARQRFIDNHPEVTLLVETVPDLPALEVDPVLIRRLLDNLLINALKHSNSSSPINIAASSKGSSIQIDVTDHGAGVPDKYLERLFEPFFRGDLSRSDTKSGTGLGLTLCKKIIQAHNGTISASKPDHGGLRISFLLPQT